MNIVEMGRRGEGKSRLALFLSRRIQQRVGAHTVAIFDPKRTFNDIPHTADLDKFEAMMETRGAWSIAYQPSGYNEEKESVEVSEQFDAFIETLGVDYHLGVRDNPSRSNLRPFVLVVDEAWLLQTRGTVNGSLANLVRLADSKNFFLLQIAHRPTDFGTPTRAQVDEVFLFKQWLPADLDVIAEWCGETVAQKVSVLPLHHLVRYEICSGKFEYWNDPLSWEIPEGNNGLTRKESPVKFTPGGASIGRNDAPAVPREESAPGSGECVGKLPDGNVGLAGAEADRVRIN